MCCYRDLKNFDRFNYVIRSLIFLIVVKLKDIKTLIANTLKLETKIVEANSPKNNDSSPTIETNDKVVTEAADSKKESVKTDNQNVEKKSKSDDGKDSESKTDKVEDIWILPDIEKALVFVSKVFLLNFPLYVAHKHGIHGRIDEITPQDLQALSMFCDIHDTEIPVYLYRNVTLFCTSGGFAAMLHCFELSNLPVSTAHACTMAISNIKLWLNYRSIVQLFVPLRIKILQYMCKLSDQDLRSSATKSMAGKNSLSKSIFISKLTFILIFFRLYVVCNQRST
jgi:ubiquitin carboxyl-terminal hydrolase 34